MMNKTTWQRVKLGEIAEFSNGKSRPNNVGNIPIYGGNGVLGYADESNCKDETIILGRVGAYCGCVYYENQPIWVSDNALIAKPKNHNSIKYIYYLLKYMNLNSHAQGSSHPLITQSLLNSLEVEVCVDYEAQQRIAEILSSLDDKIDLLHRQNKTLESLSLTLFRHTFIDNPNRNAWQIGKLGDYVTPKKGKNITHKNAIKGIYPVIAGGLEPAYYHNQSNTQSPVITISASGANAGFVNIHYCPVWSSDSSYIDSTITPYIYISYLFLKHNQNILYDKQEGSAQPHIYPSHIMELEMPHYPKELMESFETQIQVYFNKISHNMKEIQNLESLRDIMLPKLLSGEMEV